MSQYLLTYLDYYHNLLIDYTHHLNVRAMRFGLLPIDSENNQERNDVINIFSRINKELASWIAMFQLLHGLDRYRPNLELGGEAKAIFDPPPKHCKHLRRNGQEHLLGTILSHCRRFRDRLAASETRTVTALVAVYKALGGGVPVSDAKR